MKEKKIRQKESVKAKSSILWRWSMANALFFFVALSTMALVSYQIVLFSIVNLNKNSMAKTMTQISEQLSASEQALKAENFEKFLYKSSSGNSGSQLLQTSKVLSQMISTRNMNFYVFDSSKTLIFSTASSSFPFHADTGGKVISYKFAGNTGYLASMEMKSKSSQKVIGTLVTYYDLSSFNSLRKDLLLAFLGVTAFALVIAIFFGYWMAAYFFRPLKTISSSMEKVAAHPELAFEPVKLKKEDELSRIADFYNRMMERINYYIEQQRGFVSDVSHELRTPLAVIDGHLKLLKRWGKEDPEVLEESLQISIDELASMKMMLEEMLALSRSEQLSTEGLKKGCRPAEKAEQALSNFKLIHPDFTVALENHLSEDISLQIDEAHYEQALMILLDNAAKYSPDFPKSVKIELTELGDFVESSLADEGMGMRSEDLNLIFERFYRADKARHREISGTGLGLAILTNIVKQYGGGTVHVESELGHGSKFTFKIPKFQNKFEATKWEL